jgi:hypothetical protein
VKALFTLGRVVATPAALAAIEKSGQQPGDFLARHVSGDWGDLDAHDMAGNEFGLKHGFRLLSAYRTSAGAVQGFAESATSRAICDAPKPVVRPINKMPNAEARATAKPQRVTIARINSFLLCSYQTEDFLQVCRLPPNIRPRPGRRPPRHAGRFTRNSNIRCARKCGIVGEFFGGHR